MLKTAPRSDQHGIDAGSVPVGTALYGLHASSRGDVGSLTANAWASWSSLSRQPMLSYHPRCLPPVHFCNGLVACRAAVYREFSARYCCSCSHVTQAWLPEGDHPQAATPQDVKAFAIAASYHPASNLADTIGAMGPPGGRYVWNAGAGPFPPQIPAAQPRARGQRHSQTQRNTERAPFTSRSDHPIHPRSHPASSCRPRI